MKSWNRRTVLSALAVSSVLLGSGAALAIDYPEAKPLKQGSQADLSKIAKQDKVVIAYMPPATEFNYYMAIGEGIKAAAAQSRRRDIHAGAAIGSRHQRPDGHDPGRHHQKGVSAIILSTHDEAAAAPLVKKAVDKGIAVVIVNSDIADFPTPVHAVVGYSQRNGTKKLGDYFLGKLTGRRAKIGVIEGQPGYHSTERVGGFMDAVKGKPGIEIKSSVPGGWNVEGGNTAAMDLLQANPDVDTVVRCQRLHDHGRGTGCQVAGPAADASGQ